MDTLESQVCLSEDVIYSLLMSWAEEFSEAYDHEWKWETKDPNYPLRFFIDPESQLATAVSSIYVRPGFTPLTQPEVFESNEEQMNWQYAKILSYTGYEIRYNDGKLLCKPVGKGRV